MSRICLMSYAADGAWFGALLAREGHDVHYNLVEERFAPVLQGIAPTPTIIGKGEVYSPASYDLIVFDLTGLGDSADYAREMAPTIGDSSLADKLEHDRLFGLEYMQECGINVPPYEHFTDPSDGIKFVRKTKKRYVFKPCGLNDCSTTYVSKSPEDMERYMDLLFRKIRVKEYVLQEFVEGTELSTEVWINSEGYYVPNHTLETKKLMAGDVGPATGCSGNVVWMPMGETAAFRRGLKLACERLASDGYVGPIDLNSIVTQDQVYGIEWTPRFGYEGTCNLTRLLPLPFGEFMYRVATGERLANVIPAHAYAATTRLSIPPYPTESNARKIYQDGVPVEGIRLDTDLPEFYLSDVRMVPDSEELESAGVSGFIGAPICVSETMAGAFAAVKNKIESLRIPDLQWRNDVSQNCAARYNTLEMQGWLKTA
jgi:phosphoribosylamine-glycine ligase